MKANVKGVSNRNCSDQYEPLHVSGLAGGIKQTQLCAVGERRLGRDLATDSCPGNFFFRIC